MTNLAETIGTIILYVGGVALALAILAGIIIGVCILAFKAFRNLDGWAHVVQALHLSRQRNRMLKEQPDRCFGCGRQLKEIETPQANE